jgi:ATP-binding cassette subfamily B protein
LKEIAQALLNKACVSYNQINDDYLWLVSENTDNYPIGTVITQNNPTNTRLLGLSSDQLDEILDSCHRSGCRKQKRMIFGKPKSLREINPPRLSNIPQGKISDITSDIDR